MACKAYIRTPILSFGDLTEAQQAYARAEYDWDLKLDKSQFVPNPRDKSQVLHVKNFFVAFYMRGLHPGFYQRRGYWDGIHDIGTFSAYFMKNSKDGQECVIAYRCF